MSKKEKVVYKEKINWKKRSSASPRLFDCTYLDCIYGGFSDMDLSRQPFYGTGDILGRSVQICDGIPF